MDFAAYERQVDRELAEERRQRDEARANRKLFLERLFGSPDSFDWQAPPALEDFDTALAEHAAQLRNAARYIAGFAIHDDSSKQENVRAAGALANLIRANISIAKVLGPQSKPAKTVHGVAAPKDTQD